MEFDGEPEIVDETYATTPDIDYLRTFRRQKEETERLSLFAIQ